MDIGLHTNLPAADYHASPEISNSRLSLLADCPARLKHELDNPTAQTDAMKLGEAFHLAVLQPDLFIKQFAAAGRCEAITREKKQCSKGGAARFDGHWLCETHRASIGEQIPDAISVLTQAEAKQICGMVAAINAKPAARRLLDMAGPVELSACYLDIDTGVKCKMRIDKLIQAKVEGNPFVAVVDLKSTQDVCPKTLQYTLRDWGYDRQAATYMHGLPALDVYPEHFFFVFCETKPPHLVTVGRIKERSIERARKQCVADLLTYKECVESGLWPDYAGGIIDVDVPEYEYRLQPKDQDA